MEKINSYFKLIEQEQTKKGWFKMKAESKQLVVYESFKQDCLKAEVEFLGLPTVWLSKSVSTGKPFPQFKRVKSNVPGKQFTVQNKFSMNRKLIENWKPEKVKFDFDFEKFSKEDVTDPKERSSKLDYSKVKIKKFLLEEFGKYLTSPIYAQ